MVQEQLAQLRAVRTRTLVMMQDLSQKQLDYIPEPGEWSICEVVDHLILSEQVLRGEIAILIGQTRAGQTPYLYRSFAEFNARPAFIPECALPWLEVPLNVFSMFMQASMREYIMRNVPVRALAPDITLPRQEKTKAELCETLWLHEQAHQDQIAGVLGSPQFPKAAERLCRPGPLHIRVGGAERGGRSCEISWLGVTLIA